MDIKKPKFRLMKNGYDRFAVDDAVDRISFENETMRQQLESTATRSTMRGTNLARSRSAINL
jgi:cell division initiation protein